MARQSILISTMLSLSMSVASSAQQPVEAPPVPPTAATAAAATAPESDDKAVLEEIKKANEAAMSGRGGYTYDPAGRRDPFVDPLQAKSPERESEARPEGSEGMLINEVQLQGITIYGGEPIGLLMGTDAVGYFLREGDELWDGKIIAIDFDDGKIVFQQKVEDPSSPVRFREVVKKLTP